LFWLNFINYYKFENELLWLIPLKDNKKSVKILKPGCSMELSKKIQEKISANKGMLFT